MERNGMIVGSLVLRVDSPSAPGNNSEVIKTKIPHKPSNVTVLPFNQDWMF